MPPLADGFSTRPETAPGLGSALTPGTAAVLAPSRAVAAEWRDWLGSCGKTQLAVHYAESLWHSRDVELLVWIVATSRASVMSGYVEAAAAAIGTDPAGDGESVAARFVSWLGETSRPWLVVLDNLSDAADLEGLWPAGASGRVLITTRTAGTLPAQAKALVLPVGALSPREALGYLMGRLTADPDQRLGAIDLVKDLGCEPLALAQASAVIAESALSCRDYRGYFARRRDQLAEADGGTVPPAAAVTWTFSVEQADRLSPDGASQSLLALAALLDGQGIPGAVLTTPAARQYLTSDSGKDPVSQDRARDALLILERAGLLEIDATGTWPTIRMSPVVQTAIRTAMPPEMLPRAARAVADALLEAWPEDDRGSEAAGILRACTASLQQAAGDLLWADGCHEVLLRAGQSLDSARLAGPAVAYWRELVAVSDRVLGPGHPDTLVVGEQLAGACLAAGRSADAVPWFQWVLTRRIRALGPDHPGTIEARRNLGHALVAAGQLDEAVTVLDGAVGDYERVRGSDHLDTLDARDELAAALGGAGQLPAAIQLRQHTLAVRERLQGARHPDTMMTRQKLAEAYLADGRLKEALAQYKRTLADRERVLGPDHLDTIATRGSLGSAYHSAGRMASTLQHYEQARTGYERVLGADHPDTLAHRANLAHAYYAAGRLTDATTLLRDTVTRCERTLPAGDPLTQAVRESLINIAGR
ncbi:MAG TPA: FxSxx-COOH system tetratricopeptide repeat protein [Streptosporangiaceae bacterium]|nr:FxSxx-COOH system tetratricopeptide repeat protein [Streptosporangiaceae bacterium]